MANQRSEDVLPELSVIVPVFEESKRIGPSLERLCAYLGDHAVHSEIIVVDDGSTDGTSSVVEATARNRSTPIRLLRYEDNRGKGYALKVGFAYSRGRRVLFTDADLSTPIEEVEKLMLALDAGAPIAVGSRKMKGAEILVRQKPLREWLGKVFTGIVNLTIADVSDATCGFKAFDGDIGRKLFALGRVDDWTFDAEILFLANRMGHRVLEVPVRWSDAEGTKVRLGRDAVASLWGILQIRLLSLRGAYESAEAQDFESHVQAKLFSAPDIV